MAYAFWWLKASNTSLVRVSKGYEPVYIEIYLLSICLKNHIHLALVDHLKHAKRKKTLHTMEDKRAALELRKAKFILLASRSTYRLVIKAFKGF